MIRNIIRLEGLAVFIAAIYLFYLTKGTFLLFFILFLTPDISLLGYLKDKKVGALTYNFVHNYLVALILIAGGIFSHNNILLHFGIILLAHVAIDRFFGFGLKYTEDFKATHIQKL